MSGDYRAGKGSRAFSMQNPAKPPQRKGFHLNGEAEGFGRRQLETREMSSRSQITERRLNTREGWCSWVEMK